MRHLLGSVILGIMLMGCVPNLNDKKEWTYGQYVTDIKANPLVYRRLRIECLSKGETRLVLYQSYFHVAATLKLDEPAFDKCIIEEMRDNK